MIRYKKGRVLTAVVDICVPREQFRRDVHEAFNELEKWRENREYNPPGTIFSRISKNYDGDSNKDETNLSDIPASNNDFHTDE